MTGSNLATGYLSQTDADIKLVSYYYSFYFDYYYINFIQMSDYIFKRVTLADDAYQNIQAKSKGDKQNQHKLTLKIDADNTDAFHQLCNELVEQIEQAKEKIGYEGLIPLPFDLQENTLQVSWREKHHNTKVQFFEHVDGEPVQLKSNGVPNAHSGTVLSIGIRAWADVSKEVLDETGAVKYMPRVWVNVIPDVIYFLDVQTFKPNSKVAYSLEDTKAEIFDDACDF